MSQLRFLFFKVFHQGLSLSVSHSNQSIITNIQRSCFLYSLHVSKSNHLALGCVVQGRPQPRHRHGFESGCGPVFIIGRISTIRSPDAIRDRNFKNSERIWVLIGNLYRERDSFKFSVPTSVLTNELN